MNLLDDLKREFQTEWKQFSLAIYGAILLTAGFVLCLMHETGWSAFFVITGGLIDLFIVWQKLRTITSWIRGQFKKDVDRIILGSKLGLLSYFVLCKWHEPISRYDVLLVAAICVISWHLFSNEGKH